MLQSWSAFWTHKDRHVFSLNFSARDQRAALTRRAGCIAVGVQRVLERFADGGQGSDAFTNFSVAVRCLGVWD